VAIEQHAIEHTKHSAERMLPQWVQLPATLLRAVRIPQMLIMATVALAGSMASVRVVPPSTLVRARIARSMAPAPVAAK
jgi:hypothetical protein